MLEGTKNINDVNGDVSLVELVRLQGDKLVEKDRIIEQMAEMLEVQATELSKRQEELAACRARLSESNA